MLGGAYWQARASSVVAWDKTSVLQLGMGIGGPGNAVTTPAVQDGKLFAAGRFRRAGDRAVLNVAHAWTSSDCIPGGTAMSGEIGQEDLVEAPISLHGIRQRQTHRKSVRLEFRPLDRRLIEAAWNTGRVTSDAGSHCLATSPPPRERSNGSPLASPMPGTPSERNTRGCIVLHGTPSVGLFPPAGKSGSVTRIRMVERTLAGGSGLV